MFILYLLGSVHLLCSISDLESSRLVLKCISDGTPQILLAWVKKLDVCINCSVQDYCGCLFRLFVVCFQLKRAALINSSPTRLCLMGCFVEGGLFMIDYSGKEVSLDLLPCLQALPSKEIVL